MKRRHDDECADPAWLNSLEKAETLYDILLEEWKEPKILTKTA